MVTVKDETMAGMKVELKGAEANNSGDDVFDAKSLKNDVGALVVQVNCYCFLFALFCAAILISTCVSSDLSSSSCPPPPKMQSEERCGDGDGWRHG